MPLYGSERRPCLIYGGNVRHKEQRDATCSETNHLILVLDQELDTLNGRSRGFGDGGGNTAHHEVGCSKLPGQHADSAPKRQLAARLDALKKSLVDFCLGTSAMMNKEGGERNGVGVVVVENQGGRGASKVFERSSPGQPRSSGSFAANGRAPALASLPRGLRPVPSDTTFSRSNQSLHTTPYQLRNSLDEV